MASTEVKPIHAGESLRFFDLREAHGGQVRLWDYRGRRNLVLFFVQVGCSHCRVKLKQFDEAYEQIAEEEAEILVMVNTFMSGARALKHELELRCPALLDPTGEVFKRYGILDSKANPSCDNRLE